MTANVEVMGYYGKAPWWLGIENGTAIELDGLAVGDEIIRRIMPWTVDGAPVFVNGHEVPNYKAMVRSDRPSDVLGIVRSSYRPVQNEEVIGFADALVASSDAKYETAGVLANGRLVWALARLPQHVKLDGDPSETIPYLLTYAGHDGKRALTARLTMIRVVCQNTMEAAIRGAGNSYAVRHTTRYAYKLQEARHALAMSIDYVAAFEVVAADMMKRDVTTRDVAKFTEKLLPVRGEPDKAVRTMKARDEIAALFAHSDTLDGVPNTAYRLYNAVTEFVDHGRVYHATKKQDVLDTRAFSILDGQAQSLKDRALVLLAPKAALAAKARSTSGGSF
jgi:phage/plasmid-like protein (TIGR03299 family)